MRTSVSCGLGVALLLAVPVAAQETDPFWFGWAGGALGALAGTAAADLGRGLCPEAAFPTLGGSACQAVLLLAPALGGMLGVQAVASLQDAETNPWTSALGALLGEAAALGALLALDHWVRFDRVGHKVLFIKLSLYALVPSLTGLGAAWGGHREASLLR